MPHIPSLTIGMSLFLLIGWTFQPSRDVLYLMAFVLMAVVADMTYRRLDSQDNRRV
jgi:hypothetical protein